MTPSPSQCGYGGKRPWFEKNHGCGQRTKCGTYQYREHRPTSWKHLMWHGLHNSTKIDMMACVVDLSYNFTDYWGPRSSTVCYLHGSQDSGTLLQGVLCMVKGIRGLSWLEYFSLIEYQGCRKTWPPQYTWWRRSLVHKWRWLWEDIRTWSR